jgi:hypothetical protein
VVAEVVEYRARIKRVAFQTGWAGEPQYRLDLDSDVHIYLDDKHPIIRAAVEHVDGLDSLVAYDVGLCVVERPTQ